MCVGGWGGRGVCDELGLLLSRTIAALDFTNGFGLFCVVFCVYLFIYLFFVLFLFVHFCFVGVVVILFVCLFWLNL